MITDEFGLGLYIHIPFCRKKCNYCDFNSYAGCEENIPSYFTSLNKEIHYYTQKLRDYSFKTIFIGGGTPSLPESHYITDLMLSLRDNFNIQKDAEISMESNPGTLTREKLRTYKASGINRLSIGLQACQDRLLSVMGRIHNMDAFRDNFLLAREEGYENINTDIMFGIPGQSLEDWCETLEKLLELSPEHISCYSLKIEDGTAFGRQKDKGELKEIDDETDRQMYHTAVYRLKNAGFKHYEISNFTKEGFECRHNMIYWDAKEYIGIGAGAHSYFERKRFNNPVSISSYIGSIEKNEILHENIDIIDRGEEISEYMMLGLRLIDGINASHFKKRFDEDIYDIFGEAIGRLEKINLLIHDKTSIRLTPIGLDLANKVFVEFI